MTRHELSQIFYLKKELKRAEEKLEELNASIEAKGQRLTGMPFANTGETSDPVFEAVSRIIKYRDVVQGYKAAIEIRIEEVDRWRMNLEDVFLAQIVEYRCIQCLDWNTVADRIGGGNTEDGCKKYYYRHVPLK